MKKLTAFFVIFTFCLLYSPNINAQGLDLFKNYYFEMPRAEVEASAGSLEVDSEDPSLFRAAKPVTFMNREWILSFIFNKDWKLQVVSITTPFEQASFMQILTNLSNNKFNPVYASGDKDELDMIDLARQKFTEDIVIKKFSDILQTGFKADDLTILYLPADYMKTLAKNPEINNFNSIFLNVPPMIKCIVLSESRLEDGSEPELVTELNFTTLTTFKNLVIEELKKNNEKF